MTENVRSNGILIVTYNEYPCYDGLTVRLHNIAVELVRKGIPVTVLAPRYARTRIAHPWECSPAYTVLTVDVHIPSRLENIRILSRALKNALLIWRTWRQVSALRKSLHPAVVQAEEFNAIFPAVLARKACRASQLIVDDVTLIEDAIADKKIPGLRTFVRLIEKLAYRWSDRFVCASSEGVNYIQKRKKNPPVFLLPNGIDASFCCPGSNEQVVSGRIFFNCSLTNYQNLDAIRNMLGVFPAIRKEIPHATLQLICPPLERMPAGLKDLADQTPAVTLMDGVPELMPWIQNAAVAVMPYTPGEGTLGGAKIKLLEYLGCGRVVVGTTGCTAGVEGIQSGRDLIVASTLDEFRDALISVLKQPEHYTDMQRNARDFVTTHFSWEKLVSDDYVDFLFG